MEKIKSSDPNKDRNDPMIPEFWRLGEDVQDAIRTAGYDSFEVEGIAVDIHDLLQAADKICDDLGPAVVAASPEDIVRRLKDLREEIEHLAWHCHAATEFLTAAESKLSP